MLREALGVPLNDPRRSDWLFDNMATEAIVLHARNLCDFCTSPKANDIKPSDLFDNYGADRTYTQLRRLVRRLDMKYGRGGKGSARWAFNKMLAHPTKSRGQSFNYTRYLNRILPALRDVIAELARLGQI